MGYKFEIQMGSDLPKRGSYFKTDNAGELADFFLRKKVMRKKMKAGKKLTGGEESAIVNKVMEVLDFDVADTSIEPGMEKENKRED